MQRLIIGIVIIIGMMAPVIGIIIGLVRYRRHSDKVKKEVREQYKEAQEAGGVKSLYYKHEGKRIFTKTFGTPILVAFLIGLVLILVGFFFLNHM